MFSVPPAPWLLRPVLLCGIEVGILVPVSEAQTPAPDTTAPAGSSSSKPAEDPRSSGTTAEPPDSSQEPSSAQEPSGADQGGMFVFNPTPPYMTSSGTWFPAWTATHSPL